MASIVDDPNGRKRIQFIGADGRRKAVRLGKVSAKLAATAKLHIEELASAARYQRSPGDATGDWLAKLDDTFHARLAAVKLVKPRGSSTGSTALGPFFQRYIDDRTDAKPRTLINLRQARADAIKFFGESKELRDITEGDAEEFWRWMRRAGGEGDRALGTNTARRIIGRMKQIMRFAIKKRLLTVNPFDGMESHVQGSHEERRFFITRDVAGKVLDACPDAEWRLIFALSRYGGLCCPSEHLALRWADVDWDKSQIRIRSPKTEHIEGHESRLIPLFPELRPLLMEVFEQAVEGAVHVITRYRDGNANLRTQLQRIITRAGVTPWPKLFHNLRATRQTELEETFPGHVVCAWIGNSQDVARKHYLQLTDAHFAKAIESSAGSAAHKAAHSDAEPTGTHRKGSGDRSEKAPVFPGHSDAGKKSAGETIPPRGVEPLFSG